MKHVIRKQTTDYDEYKRDCRKFFTYWLHLKGQYSEESLMGSIRAAGNGECSISSYRSLCKRLADALQEELPGNKMINWVGHDAGDGWEMFSVEYATFDKLPTSRTYENVIIMDDDAEAVMFKLGVC